jgi:hypothetical protein
MENIFIQKIPLNPPLAKVEDARKDSLRVVDPTSPDRKKISNGTSENDRWFSISFEKFSCPF